MIIVTHQFLEEQYERLQKWKPGDKFIELSLFSYLYRMFKLPIKHLVIDGAHFG